MYFYSATSPPNTTKQTLDKFKIGEYEAHKTLVTKIEKLLGVAQAGPGGPCERFPGTTNPELELLIKSTGDGGIVAKLQNPSDLSVIGSVNEILDVIRQQNEKEAEEDAAAEKADKQERHKEGQEVKTTETSVNKVTEGVTEIIDKVLSTNVPVNTPNIASGVFSTIINNIKEGVSLIKNDTTLS